MTKVDKSTPPEVLLGMLIAAQAAQLFSLEKQALLENEVGLLKHKLFGSSSEKKKRTQTIDTPLPMNQVFDEATVGADPVDEEEGVIEEDNQTLDDAIAISW